MTERVTVVGGGITGLSAAHQLLLDGAEVIVLEASDRVGGAVRTSDVGGIDVESGPDGFLARHPEVGDLCREIGLGAELVSPSTGRAYMWADGDLRAIPRPSVLGVPLDPESLAMSGLVSDDAVEQLRRGLAADHRPLTDDDSVGAVLRPRVSDQVFERLVDPLLGGINAGNADEMSIEANAAPLYEAVRRGGPLGSALTANMPSATPGPVFLGLRGGMPRLVDALALRLSATVRLCTPASAISRTTDGWSVETSSGTVTTDRVILTTPAPVTAALLEPLSPDAASILGAIGYADVALVTYVVDATRIERPLDGSGFLVPRDQGLLMTACSWTSSKWRHYRHENRAILRVSAGRTDDNRWLDLEPDELVHELTTELHTTIGFDGPADTRVTPWRQSLPQYRPGHFGRIAQAEDHLADSAPGVTATGAAFRGLGLPACVRQGRTAAMC